MAQELKINKEQADARVNELMKSGYHCGPTTVKVMQEAWGLDDSMVWAGNNFYGGITGLREGVCGAISGLGIALGFKYRTDSDNEEEIQKARELSRQKTEALVKEFKEKHGSIVCAELIKVDFNKPEEVEAFKADPKNADICPGMVRWVVEKMMEL